jgi:DNA polymerase III epsilon subunit-like protein
MDRSEWVLIDTETNGLRNPILPVELAAQRMSGWARSGPPFRRLLNQNAELSPEASRVNGYTREILERDGEEPDAVYAAFDAYAGERPIVSYNLGYDYDQVLIPEWQRRGLKPRASRGLCALRLAQRLLDPVPAGNCKLQTLRQYYRLPERGAHTALGDVDTVVDLLQIVLRPLAEARGLTTWETMRRFSEETWYPSRIAFGKYKGRDYREARGDGEFLAWLEWLETSSNRRSASMGRWYLRRLHTPSGETYADAPLSPFASSVGIDIAGGAHSATGAGLVLFVDRDLERLRALVALARSRLADIEADYMAEREAVSAMSATLFRLVRVHSQRRDRLQLIVRYRRWFIDVLTAQGEEAADDVAGDFEEARAEADREYEDASRAAEAKQGLTDSETSEIKALWKRLVQLYHPDRYVESPEKQAVYEQLTAAINEARDAGDLATLREISGDPDGFIARKGWIGLGIGSDTASDDLLKLYQAIEIQIVERLDALERLRESPETEFARACRQDPTILEHVAKEQIAALEAEINRLTLEADRLGSEIAGLTGEPAGSRI